MEVPRIEDVDLMLAKFEVQDNADIGTHEHAQIMAEIESHYHFDSPFTHNTGLVAWDDAISLQKEESLALDPIKLISMMKFG